MGTDFRTSFVWMISFCPQFSKPHSCQTKIRRLRSLSASRLQSFEASRKLQNLMNRLTAHYTFRQLQSFTLISPEATAFSQPSSESSSEFSISDSSASDTVDSKSEQEQKKKRTKTRRGIPNLVLRVNRKKKKNKWPTKDSESSSESEKRMKKRKKNKRKHMDTEFSTMNNHKKNTSNKKHSQNNKLCEKKQRKHA